MQLLIDRLLGTLIVLALLQLFSGCASVNVASVEEDRAAKELSVPAGMTTIVIFRDGYSGTFFRYRYEIDAKYVGDLAPMTFLRVDISPGQHTVTMRSSGGSNSVRIQTARDKLYFVGTDFLSGLHAPSEQNGRKKIVGMSLVDTTRGSSDIRPPEESAADVLPPPVK